MAIFDTLAKPLLDSVNTLIQNFHLSPEQQVQAQQAITDAAQKVQLASQDYDTQLNAIAGQNIRTEEGSGDGFTRRARPAVIWMGNVLVLWNYAVAPLLHMSPVMLPDAFWWTWGTVVTGYVFSRSTEKIMSLSGDSQINLGGLLKVGNSSAK